MVATTRGDIFALRKPKKSTYKTLARLLLLTSTATSTETDNHIKYASNPVTESPLDAETYISPTMSDEDLLHLSTGPSYYDSYQDPGGGIQIVDTDTTSYYDTYDNSDYVDDYEDPDYYDFTELDAYEDQLFDQYYGDEAMDAIDQVMPNYDENGFPLEDAPGDIPVPGLQKRKFVTDLTKDLPKDKRKWSKEQLKARNKIRSINRYRSSPWGMVAAHRIATNGRKIGPELYARKFIDYGCWCFQSSEETIPLRMPQVDEFDSVCRELTLCEQCVEMDSGQNKLCSKKGARYPNYGAEISKKGKITCTDPLNSCEHAYCMCHKTFTESLPKRIDGNKNYFRHRFDPPMKMKGQSGKARKQATAKGSKSKAGGKKKKTPKAKGTTLRGKTPKGASKGRRRRATTAQDYDYNYSEYEDADAEHYDASLLRRNNIDKTKKEPGVSLKSQMCVVPKPAPAASIIKAMEAASSSGAVLPPVASNPLDSLTDTTSSIATQVFNYIIGEPQATQVQINSGATTNADGSRNVNAVPQTTTIMGVQVPIMEKRERGKPNKCCGLYPKRHPYTADENHKCCGGKTYNTNIRSCCGNDRDGETFNTFTHECCLKNVLSIGLCV